MRRARTSLVVAALWAALTLGCSYTPTSNRTWTRDQARKVLLDFERGKVGSGEAALRDQVEVTDAWFDDYFLCQEIYRQGWAVVSTPPHFETIGRTTYVSGPGYGPAVITWTEPHYALRRIYFRDIESVSIRWSIEGLLTPLASVGIVGPYTFELRARLRPGAKVPSAVYEKPGELILADLFETDHMWLNFIPFWIVPVRPFMRSDDVGEALKCLVESAPPAP